MASRVVVSCDRCHADQSDDATLRAVAFPIERVETAQAPDQVTRSRVDLCYACAAEVLQLLVEEHFRWREVEGRAFHDAVISGKACWERC